MKKVKVLLILLLMVLTGQMTLAQSEIEMTDSTSTEWNDNIDIDIPVMVNKYNITFASADVDMGTVSMIGGGDQVAHGARVTVTATPLDGYEFVNWTVGGTVRSADNPYTFTASEDVTLVGHFQASVYRLTYYIDGAIVLSLDVEYGALLAPYEPIVGDGRQFDGWQETVPQTMPSHDMDIHGTTSIVYGISVTSADADMGTVSMIGGGDQVAHGSRVTVTATPLDGYEFVNWTVGGTVRSADNPYTFTASEDITLVGHFQASVYRLTYYIDGAIVLSLDVEYGALLAPYEPIVGDGRQFDGWQETVPQTMPSHDMDIHGTTSIVYGISVTSADADMGTVSMIGGGEQVAHGSRVTVTATPLNGYEFVNWTVGESVRSADNPYTFTASEDITLVGHFQASVYRLTYYIDGAIVLSLDVEYGTLLAPYEPIVGDGRQFDGWQETVPQTMPSHDVDIHGTTSIVYGISVTSADADMGTVSMIGDGDQVAHGSRVTVTATPLDGYEFVNWTVGGTVRSADNPYTFTASEDITLVGHFQASVYRLTYYIDGAIVLSLDVEYGALLAPYEPIVGDGRQFDGWQETVPQTMPSHDVDIHGTTSILSAIPVITKQTEYPVNVYSLNGVLVMKDADAERIKTLPCGIYIINRNKYVKKE